MKRKIFLFATAMIIALAAGAQSPFFKKCENVKGVTTVYVSKAMLEMAGNIGGIGLKDKTLLTEKIDNTQIVTSDNAKGREFIDKHLNMITSDKEYEVLVQINDDKENVRIYRQNIGKGKSRYVVICKEPEETTVITIEGSLSLEDVARCTKR